MTKTEYYLLCGIYKRWHNRTLANYDNDDKTLKRVKRYIKNSKTHLDSGVGIYFYGDNGVGKSHLMNAAFKELIEQKYSVRVISLSDLVTKFAEAWYDDAAKDEFELLKTRDFVGIEEIGKEFRSSLKDADSKNEDLIVTVLDNILRYRLQNCLPTWFTSNLAPSDVKDKYSQDIFSMLKECAVPILVKGVDYRDIVNTGEI